MSNTLDTLFNWKNPHQQDGVDQTLLQQVALFARDKGINEVTVNSGKRTHAEQEHLYNTLTPQGVLVAKPGTSRHETGHSLDMNFAGVDYEANDFDDNELAQYGLHRPVSGEPWHFELLPSWQGKPNGSWGAFKPSKWTPYNAPKDPIQTPLRDPLEPAGFLQQATDKFEHSLYDSTVWGVGRVLYHGERTGAFGTPYQVTQSDVDYVTKALPGDYIAQKFALMNANSEAHLAALVGMKQADKEREARVERYSFNLASIGTIGGAILDPTNLIPLGSQATILKTIGRLGIPTAAKLSMSKIAKAGDIAVQTALINTAERKGAEVFSGYQQDYAMSALVGGVAGAGLSFLGDVLKSKAIRGDKGAQKLYTALSTAEDSAIRHAADLPVSSAIPKNTIGDVKSLHDMKGLKFSPRSTFAELVQGEKAFVLPKESVKSLSKRWGVDISDTAKAFHKVDEGYTVLVKDNLKPTDNLDNIIAHEVGVHAGLERSAGTKQYTKIKRYVEQQIENPKGAWKGAVRAVKRGGWEEVLGHYIEQNGLKNPTIKGLQGSINKGLRKIGLTKDLTEAEIKDFVKRSLDAEVEKARGYRVLGDGRVVKDGFMLSDTNIFNPHIMQDYFDIDTKAATQAEFYNVFANVKCLIADESACHSLAVVVAHIKSSISLFRYHYRRLCL